MIIYIYICINNYIYIYICGLVFRVPSISSQALLFASYLQHAEFTRLMLRFRRPTKYTHTYI